MLTLKPIAPQNIHDFQGTSYDNMSYEQKQNMIQESVNKLHNGLYFEILVVYQNDTVIGFMNLYAHSDHIISCGPSIKEKFQNKGFGYLAETMALHYAKKKGYTIAVARVRENNTASITLHERLGFTLDEKYINTQGKTIWLYTKVL